MAKARATKLQDEYLRILGEMSGDAAGREAGDAHLDEAFAKYGNLQWATNPLIFDADQYEMLDNAATTFASIMEKVMARYQRDPYFRKLFALTTKLEHLTRVPSGCHAAVPLARLDLFYDPVTSNFHIAGVTTGGVDGMATSVAAMRAVKTTGAYRAFAAKHADIEEFDPLVACLKAVLNTYASWANAEEGRNHPTNPSFAIVDVAGSPRASETATAVSRLTEMGYYAHATDLSELRIQTVGGLPQLVDNQGPVTCVWLRAKAEEALAVEKGLDALVEATRRGLVCTVGGYRSWPCCVRSFFSVLRSKQCRMLLSEEENAFIEAHVPDTYVLETSLDLSEFYDQENWVLRETDGRDVSGFHVGKTMRKADWRKALVKGIKHHYVVQEYIAQKGMRVAMADAEGLPTVSEQNAMLSLYVFGGKLAGIGATCSASDSDAAKGDLREMACMVVRD